MQVFLQIMKTPALNFLSKAKVNFSIHQYDCKELDHFAVNSAKELGVAEECVFKTLLFQGSDNKFICCIVAANAHVSLKRLARALKLKSVKLASEALAIKETGYVIGGISPFGQRKKHLTVLDDKALNLDLIYVSAGERGLSVAISPKDLVDLLQATVAAISGVD